MRTAGVLALLGVGCLVAAGLRGELDFHLLLVFPVITGTGPLGVLGILLLMAAGVAAFFGAARRATAADAGAWDVPPEHVRADAPREPAQTGASRTRHGGVVLLGPFPIVWGSDRGMAKGLVVLALVLAAIVLAIMLLPLLVR